MLAVGAALLSPAAGVANARGDGGALSVAPVASELSRHAVEWRRAWLDASDSLARPIRGKVTGWFGELRAGHVHEGVDIPAPKGTPILAAGDGTVVMREDEAGYGRYTCIAHVTITSCYAHQSRFAVRRGERVRQGEVIGYVGDTGRAYAVHLHFEVRRGTRPWGKPVSPMRRLRRPSRSRSSGHGLLPAARLTPARR